MINTHPRTTLYIILATVLFLGSVFTIGLNRASAQATVITVGYTSFEEPGLGTRYTDTGDPLTDHTLQNNSGQSPVSYAGGGELGFTAAYANTQNSTGLTDGDDVGVTDALISYPEGTQGFQFSDTDGRMTLTLDTVDFSAVTNAELYMQYYVQETSWESDDTIHIWLEVDGGATIDVLNTTGNDIDDLAIEGSWITLHQPLGGYSSATLHISLESDSGLESLHVDHIIFQGSVNSQAGLNVTQTITEEPLLGGDILFDLTLNNTGITPVFDKGYNLTISNTLPAGLIYLTANPAPTFIEEQEDGTTLIFWDNIADLDAAEELSIELRASISESLTIADQFTNQVTAAFNTVPDNSGTWLTVTDQLTANAQAIDIEALANQSTADEQATGAGEYDGSADWPYSYTLTVANNDVGQTDSVSVTAILPPSLAYMGNPQISPNPNSSNVVPTISLETDGSLVLSWELGTLTTAEYSQPVEITFDTAIPYRFRTAADTAAATGPFAGPMSGAIIYEDVQVELTYEATAIYEGANTADGTESTPQDDEPVTVIGEYFTVSKTANPNVVGIGSTVDYTINLYVSEYYSITNGVVVDVLPDGVTYVADSASSAPISIEADTPNKGETTLTWHLDSAETEAGDQSSITFQVTVDSTYDKPPYTGEPIVSGDSLTNKVTIYGDWADDISNGRSGTITPDVSRATVTTRMPTFSKQVIHPISGQLVDNAPGFVGDTLTFQLNYDAAADIDAKEIVIRDFLPRGMSYVTDSDSYLTSGTFSNSGTCTSTPTAPTVGTLNGLQYLEWRLCSTAQGSSWQVTIDALVGPTPNVEAGWIVANFGKLSGQNSYAQTYSLRDMATIDYVAPHLVLTKSASPSTGLDANDTVNYTISVTNNGDATAYNLVLTDLLPADVIFNNSGGSASPASSSYSLVSGDPAAATGGTVQWANVPSLAAGETQTYQYSATIPSSGLIAGQSMTNLASVAYNSRPDNNGHQIETTTNTDDDNTDNATIYIRGLTIEKSASPTIATIGDTVTWSIVGTVPDGVSGYWPVVEENNLPNGFDYVTGSTNLTSSTGLVTFDPDHGNTPLDNGQSDLRWFLSSITNTTGSNITFTLTFDTLVTGVNGNNINQTYFNCCNANADNDAYIGWYDDATGYSNTGSAYDAGYSVNNIDRRSPEADGDVKIRQPRLTLDKSSNFTYMAAGGILEFTLQVKNTGRRTAYDIVLTDTLPVELTFANTASITISPDNGENSTDSNSNGDRNLTYTLDQLPQNATWTIKYAVNIDTALEAGLEVENIAQVTSYSTQPGTPADSNGDTLADERTYVGPTDQVRLYAPQATIFKEQHIEDELTFANTVVYTLTVPQTPIPAIMQNVVVTDLIDDRLTVTNVSNGTFTSNSVSATFGSIGINAQEVIVITAELPTDSSAINSDIINNQATLSYEHDDPINSNIVAAVVVAPMLTTSIDTETFTVVTDDVVTYTAQIENVGGGRADQMGVHLTIPTNMSFVSGSATLNNTPLVDPTGNSWDLSGDSLAAGESHTLVFQARVNSLITGVPYNVAITASGVDSQGNAIPADNSARVTSDNDPDDSSSIDVYGPLTCTPENTSIAFEDLKNTGWSDWDYNDLIVQIDTEVCASSSNDVAIINVDYLPLARGAGFTHSFWHDLPVNGSGRYQIDVYTDQGVPVRTVRDHFTEAADFEIFSNTKEVFAPPTAGCPDPSDTFNCLSYVNTFSYEPDYRHGYRAELIVLLDQTELNPTADLPPAPWDPYIAVFDTGEEVHLVIPGHLDNSQTVGVTYDPGNPMVGYDLPLVQTFDVSWDWPIEFSAIWRGYPDYVNHIATGGTENLDWLDENNADTSYLWTFSPLNRSYSRHWVISGATAVTSRYFAPPVVADLDGDGSQEVIIGNLVSNQVEVRNSAQQLLWTRNVGGGVKVAVAVADLDDNPADLEILVPSEDGNLYAFHHDGSAVNGWAVKVGGDSTTQFRVLSTPAVADIAGDSAPEIAVAGSNGRLYIFNQDGTLFWERSIGSVLDSFDSQVINSSPVIADLDGNGDLEIVVGSYDGAVYAFTAEGTQLWRYQTRDVIMATPAIADIDATINGLEIAIGSGDGYLYLLDEAGDLIWKQATDWSIRSSALLANMDGSGDLEIVVGSDDDSVWAWHADGSTVTNWPQTTGADVFASPTLGDVNGDGTDEIVSGSDDGSIYVWEMDGTAVTGWPQSVGASVKGSPVVINLDDDVMGEIIYSQIDGDLDIIGTTYMQFIPLVIR